jgi:hypothetical protein
MASLPSRSLCAFPSRDRRHAPGVRRSLRLGTLTNPAVDDLDTGREACSSTSSSGVLAWPLWLLTMDSAVLGALVWFGLGVMRRHRRRKERRQDRRD